MANSGKQSSGRPAQRATGLLYVVGHEKGGVGKSALAANLAAACAIEGLDVVLVDTDRTRTNASWGKIRAEVDGLAKVTVIEAPTNPLATIHDLVDRYDVMVVDLAAGDYANLPKLAMTADLLIVPTGVGREVLESTVRVANTMRALDVQHRYGRVPMVCIFNAVRPIASEEAAAREELARNCPDLPIAPVTVYDRKVFRDASWEGRSVFEMPKRLADKAVTELSQAIKFAMATSRKISQPTRSAGKQAQEVRA